MNSWDIFDRSGISRLAASYARKSNNDLWAVRKQHEYNAEHAETHGLIIPDDPSFQYGDNDISGAVMIRPDLERLLGAVEKGPARFQVLVVREYSRFCRSDDLMEGMTAVQRVVKAGIEVYFVDEDIWMRPNMPTEEQRRTIDKLIAAAEHAAKERQKLIKRVRIGLVGALQSGFYPGSSAPYGMARYLTHEKSGKLIQRVPRGMTIRMDGHRYTLQWGDARELWVVRFIFLAIAFGVALNRIARRLNDSGVAPPFRANAWNTHGIRRVARNPIYCGSLLWRMTNGIGEPVPVHEIKGDAKHTSRMPLLLRDVIPDPPISARRFDLVQAILDGFLVMHDRRRDTSPGYRLSGLLRCEACGMSWHGHSGDKSRRRRRSYYRHDQPSNSFDGRRAKLNCVNGNRYLRLSEVEEAAFTTLRSALMRGSAQAEVERLVSAAVTDLGSDHRREQVEGLERALAVGRRRLQNLMLDKADRRTAQAHEEYDELIRLTEDKMADRTRELRDLMADEVHLEGLLAHAGEFQALAERVISGLDEPPSHYQKRQLARLVACIWVSPGADRLTIVLRTGATP